MGWRSRSISFGFVVLCCWGIDRDRAAADETAQDQVALARPNIVLIFADDLGIADLGLYGRSEHSTPRLDRLATEGMRFDCAYAAQPICSPSRAALLTGLHPARLHLTNYLPGRADAVSQRLRQPVIAGQLPLEETTLAEVLREAGYATGLFGKWHLGNGSFGPQSQGFDTVFLPPGNSTPAADEQGKSEFAITREAITFIEANRDRPFFCYVPHHSPHIPLAAAADRVARHADAYQPTYAAMIETLDEAVGSLLDALDRLELTERTIVIFTSDNGGLHVLEFPGNPATHNAEFRAGKGYVYEGGIREPFIASWPGKIPAGKVTDQRGIMYDLFPTFCEVAGIKPSPGLDGVSLLPTLTAQGKQPQHPFLYWEFAGYGGQQAVQQGPWKAVRQKMQQGNKTIELYNLTSDPNETKDVAAENPQVVTELEAVMLKEHTPSELFPIFAIDGRKPSAGKALPKAE